MFVFLYVYDFLSLSLSLSLNVYYNTQPKNMNKKKLKIKNSFFPSVCRGRKAKQGKAGLNCSCQLFTLLYLLLHRQHLLLLLSICLEIDSYLKLQFKFNKCLYILYK